ncbi:MAG: BREX-1 system adenine-specific DNA-methyltransferase PglX [bacterium]
MPTVTQLFTPHWIVRYLVENSLGRLWLHSRPGSRLREHMPYYVDDPEGQPPADSLTIARPEDIRLLDPAPGSGHMLTYSFDLLYFIYEEEGHAPNEIPALILRHNLYGLEICPRATQLAQFALVCKAREKSRSAFRNPIQPQVMCLEDVDLPPEEMSDYLRLPSLREFFTEKVLRQIHQFRENTSTLGSLIQPVLSVEEIAVLKSQLARVNPGDDLLLQETHRKVLLALDQTEMLSQRYQVIVANPPYLGIRQTNVSIKVHADSFYPQSKPDLYSMFVERCLLFVFPRGLVGMVTMQSWMFLTSFESFRGLLFKRSHISTMAHLGPRAFDSISGEVVQTTAFALVKSENPDRKVVYLDATKGSNEAEKEQLIREKRNAYSMSLRELSRIPGAAVAYWVSPRLRRLFSELKPLGKVAQPRQGMATSDNERFLRYWHEVAFNKIAFGCRNHADSRRRAEKWYPYNKGGSFRRWFGNNDYVVNWQHDGEELKAFVEELNKRHPGGRLKNKEFCFLENLTYNALSGGHFSCRHNSPGFLFDTKGSCIFIEHRYIWNLLGFLNSPVAQALLDVLCPTLDYSSIGLNNLPYQPSESGESNTKAAIALARADWDNSEASWDFRDHPLLRSGLKGPTLEASWRNWEVQSTAAIGRMQELETENNRVFIAAYGLDGELQPEVPEAEISLTRADARHDMAAFLSYAIGCLMGRYGLDHPGLILANAGDSVSEFLEKVERPQDQLTFAPDEDGIIPVLDGEWFEDDIVARTRDFLRATFGETTLEENLRFIEESLGKDLRKYFLTDFYKDHLQTYKKRPIYWIFQSPKKSFSALIYLHRYTRDTVNLLLNRYLRDYLHKLRARIEHLEHLQGISENARERRAARKESDALKKNLHECEEYEREILLPLAKERIELDLDDGVKVNYLKFGKALAPIPGLAAKEGD